MNKLLGICFMATLFIVGLLAARWADPILNDGSKIGLGLAVAVLLAVIVLRVSLSTFDVLFKTSFQESRKFFNSVKKVGFWIIFPPLIVLIFSALAVGIIVMTQ